MSQPTRQAALERLSAFIGEWSVEGPHPFDPAVKFTGTNTFEWLDGNSFVLQRSRGEAEEFPDGVMIIGWDDVTGRYTQCYSDSRGIHRIYEMSLDDGVWRLWREQPGFWQRFSGTFGADGATITGAWEKSMDDGTTWEHDFDLTYTKVT